MERAAGRVSVVGFTSWKHEDWRKEIPLTGSPQDSLSPIPVPLSSALLHAGVTVSSQEKSCPQLGKRVASKSSAPPSHLETPGKRQAILPVPGETPLAPPTARCVQHDWSGPGRSPAQRPKRPHCAHEHLQATWRKGEHFLKGQMGAVVNKHAN